MRAYLAHFFEEFDYASDDAAVLLSAYDAVCADDEASRLFSECLDLYEKNIHMDYEKEILKTRSRTVAALVGIHPYTADLLIFLCMTRRLRALYAERGISEEIYRQSALDLKWKLWECKAVKGICGSFVAAWFPGFFDLTRFAIGRLQFEVIPFGDTYEKDGVRLTPESLVINVHIPRTGTPMDKESCEASYERAAAFFADAVGEPCCFVCHSWLLYPEHLHMLSPSTNVYRFASEYDIVRSGTNSGNDLWRLFDTDERDPDKLPADTSLRRAYVGYLKNGGKPGWGMGVRRHRSAALQ